MKYDSISKQKQNRSNEQVEKVRDCHVEQEPIGRLESQNVVLQYDDDD